MKDPYATYFEDREYAEIARREHLIGREARKREAINRGRFNWRAFWCGFFGLTYREPYKLDAETKAKMDRIRKMSDETSPRI